MGDDAPRQHTVRTETDGLDPRDLDELVAQLGRAVQGKPTNGRMNHWYMAQKKMRKLRDRL